MVYLRIVPETMEIREATEGDIPAIVQLLKASLGEGLMPKSERYWRWKHIDNPFGPSPVVLAFDGPKLVGVRAFMRWQWKSGDQLFKAVRAVDTATHPEYQGKGIFKKLTLTLVDSCTAAGDQFVFNTPNEKSKPGYLKMGWEEAGKLPIRISVRRPLNILKNLALGGSSKDSMGSQEHENKTETALQNPAIINLIAAHAQHSKLMATHITPEYLHWRYVQVPVARYMVFVDEGSKNMNALIIGRLKASRFGLEFRITDSFTDIGYQAGRLRGLIHDNVRRLGADYLTVSGLFDEKAGGHNYSGIKLTAGPTVTVRALAMKDIGGLKAFASWMPSLGDLELF